MYADIYNYSSKRISVYPYKKTGYSHKIALASLVITSHVYWPLHCQMVDAQLQQQASNVAYTYIAKSL